MKKAAHRKTGTVKTASSATKAKTSKAPAKATRTARATPTRKAPAKAPAKATRTARATPTRKAPAKAPAKATRTARAAQSRKAKAKAPAKATRTARAAQSRKAKAKAPAKATRTTGVLSSTPLKLERVKGGKSYLFVAEKYQPTRRGPRRKGITRTAPTIKARNKSQKGESNQGLDTRKAARAPGLRISPKAKTYYEYRENRSDASHSRRR